MNTIKTAIVVLLLLVVLYGVYMAINQPEALRSHFDSAPVAESPLQIDPGIPFTPGDSYDPSAEAARLDHPSSEYVGSNTRQADGSQTKMGGSGTHHDSHVDLASAAQPNMDPSQDQFSLPDESAPSSPPQVTLVSSFEDTWRTATSDMQNQRYREALAALSVYWDSPDLSSEQTRRLSDALDPLAAKVIYSREHLLEDPYLVRRGDTLELIARRLDVPAQLLQNINGVNDPNVLVPGARLKVARGPFRAVVNLTNGKLALFLGDLYAGWFPVGIGSLPPMAGSYQVQFKEPGWVYYARSGQTIPARHATNPYGDWWIDLGGDVSIHGSPTSNTSGTSGLGCISLSPRDAADVYGILSEKSSQVEIRR